MDELLRELERLAAAGDLEAASLLRSHRIRLNLCPDHGLLAADPAGWGSILACPICEEELWCSTGTCFLSTCHHCYPQFDCEYGHQSCYQMEDATRNSFWGDPDIPPPTAPDWEDDDYPEYSEYEDEDSGRYDCPSCQGTGIGYPVDSNCSWCGGSGISRF